MSEINWQPVIHSKTAATRPLPIERALKTDILSILVAYCRNVLIIPPININEEDTMVPMYLSTSYLAGHDVALSGYCLQVFAAMGS